MGKQMLCKILRLLSVTWIVVVVLSSSFPNSIARAAPNPFLTTDYYGSVLNSNGTLGLVDKVSGQTIVDNVPGFFLDYGNASTIAVTPENPSFEVTSNGSDIPYGWIVDKAYIRQSAEQDSETWDLAVTGNSSDGHISIVNTTNSSSANYTLRAGETVHAPLSGSDLYEIYFGNDSSNALSASLTGNYSTASSPSPRELFSADVSAEPGMAALVYGPFTIGHSLVFDMTSTDADNRRAFSSLIPADPDKTYSGSVDSYYGSFTSGAGQANIFITYYTTDDGGGPVSTQGINIRVPDDIGAWNTNSFKWVPPYGTRSFRIELYADMGEVSTLYFDNIRVNENTTQYRTNGSDTASTVSTSGDDVTVVSVDDSNPDATVTNTYELNVHSPNVTFTSNITYKHDVTVWEERFDFVVPTQTATVMTRDLRLNEFDTTKEYLSDLYTPKVVKFSNGLSFLGADTMQAMRLRPNGGNSQLSLYGDYYLDHPYYYYVKNGNGLMTDISPQMQPGGSSHIASVTFTVSPGTTPNTLVKTRAPSGYDAALVLTNHADYETLPANRAVAYGTEDASSPAYGTKGILGRGLGWTKSVFLSGESAPYVDLSNPAYKELTDKMHLSGAEIITHAVGGHTAGRSEVDSGLQLLTQYESRNWIDHHATGGVDNWQDLASQGTIKGDPNYTLDLLARYGYKYAWSYANIETEDYDLNALSPQKTDLRAPFLYYNRNLDDNPGHDEKIYLWAAQQTNPAADLYYAGANVDNLIAQRGIHIGHDYMANGTNQGHTWYVNPATNKAEISPLFDGELAYIESRKAAGSLWVPTMVQLGDYLTLLPNVSVVNNLDGTYTVTNNNATSVDAVTLLAESAVQSATFEGVPLASFGGDLGSNEIVLPSLNPGQSATLEVNLAPSVTTSTASPGTTTATIFGMLTHLGSTGGANVSFEWGETTSYGNTTSALTLTRAGEFSAILFGLAPGVTYHFKAKANGGVSGAAYGEDAAFTTYGDSFSRFEYYHAHTNGTSAGYHAAQILTPWVTHTIKSAKLMLANAGASSGNLTVSIRATDEEGAPFGPDLIAAPPIEESSIGAGYSVYNFDLGDGYLLQAGTKYAISLKADMPGIFIMLDTSATYAGGWYSSSNNGLDGFGNWNEHNRIWDIWFEEWGNAYFSGGPSVITASADQVTSSGARLNGFVESLGSAVSANVSFRYAPSTIADLDQGTRLNGTPYSLSAPDTFGAVLAGLEPDTAYHFRAVAEATGVIIAYGSDVTFVTAPATSAPSVTTNAPSGVTTTAALFNGNLAGLGTAPTVRASFEWGTASGVYSNSTSPRTMASTGPFSQAVSGLSPATTYFFRARADGGVAGIDFGDEMTFSTSTPPTPPSVMTSPASGITQTSASLNGNITSLGTAPSASVSFEYGKTTAYGNTIPGSPQQLSATGAFIANLAGLETSTLYHFRAKALGATGTAYGGDMTFTTAAIAPPVAATSAASNILPTSATLGGVITSAGSATHVEVSFEYGPTGAYGSTVSGTPSNPSVSGTFGANLTGLAPDTLYHYRAKADGGDAGTGYGNDAVFVTPPSVTTGEVAEVSPFSALLSGNVGQLGAGRSANVSFEWGPAPGSYNAETAPRLNSEGAFSDYVTGLSPNTTYYYRAKAVGSATGFGAERSFATLSVTSPTVRTLDPLTVGYTSATLTASLISLGTAPAVDVFFEWGTDSGNLSNRTAARSLTAPVSLNATISGLSPGTTYYFQAKADGGPIHGLALGGVKSFTALSTPSGTGGGGVGGGGGGGGGSLGGTTVTLAGFTTTTLQLDSSGAVPQDVRLSSGDGTVIVELSAGAKLIEATGETLKSMAWSGAAVLTGVPPDRVVISAWSLGPNGARFDPGITLTAKFDPQILPSRIEASGLYLAYWTDDAWNGLTSTVDAHAGTVTAEVTHFTLFALMGKSPAPAAAPPTTAAPAATPARFIVSDLAISPQRIQPGQEVSITVKVTNFGGTRGDYELTPTINGDRREGKVLTLDPGVSETIRFSVTESVSGAYEVAVNGLNGSFIVENPSQGVPPTPPTSPPQETPGSNPADASAGESSVQASIGGTASTGLNWPAVVGGAAGILIAIGVTFWFVKRERSSNA